MPEPRAAQGAGRARRARGSLNAEKILAAAQKIVDRDGLAQLSLPALARRLRAGVTSIYWYFPSKDALIAALAVRVGKELLLRLPPIGDGPWADELVRYFGAFRDLMRSTPVYREVLAYRGESLLVDAAMGSAVLRRMEAGLGLLTRAGLSADDAAVAFNACTNYTRGFVVMEHVFEVEAREAPFELGEGMLPLDPVRYPVLGPLAGFEAAWELTEKDFRNGLLILVEGIRAAGRAPAPGTLAR